MADFKFTPSDIQYLSNAVTFYSIALKRRINAEPSEPIKALIRKDLSALLHLQTSLI